MAQLDLQQKRGISPLWWILGLIILALLAWWLFAPHNRTPVAVVPVNPVPVVATPAVVPAVAPAVVAVPVATTVEVITAVPTPADLVGRPIQMRDVAVQSVVSDKGFWVGPSVAQRVFVVLPEAPTPNAPPDSRYNVNPGQRLTLSGVVERMPTDLTQQTTTWNLKSTDVSALARHPLYVRADSLTILSR